MSLLEIEKTAARRDTTGCEETLASVNAQIEAIQSQIEQMTDPATIALLQVQKALLVATALGLTQAVAALLAHEANIARWIATMAQPVPELRALADTASELLALLNSHEKKLRVSKDSFRASDESTWAMSISLSDLGRKREELGAKRPNVNAAKVAWKEAQQNVLTYLGQWDI